jgi:uncharacterized membrane protein YbhN (UPF0104 family)/tRNA A-37 threonylcarbamoyl transferase component Bud32
VTADSARASEALLARTPRRHWSPSVFGVVERGANRRRPTDVVRVVVAVVVVAVTGAGAHRVLGTERRWFDLVSGFPDWLRTGAVACFRISAVATPLIVVVALVVARRFRILGTLAVSAAIAAACAIALREIVDAGSARTAANMTVDGRVPEYPVVLLTVATTVLLVASPFLLRPARRLLHAALAVAAIAAFLAVLGLPDDIVGAFALGWGVAAAFHLAFGSPAANPSLAQVTNALSGLGVNVADVRLAEDQVWGESRFTGTAPDGARVSIEVIGRDASDARLLAKVWRAIWYKDSGPSLQLTRAQQLEHRAYLLLLALRAGVPVSEVVIAGVAGAQDDAVLVLCEPEGEPLASTAPDLVTDAVLDSAWRDLGRLHDHRIAHGSMRASSVLLRDDETTAFVELSHATTDASPEQRALDRAGLLATTAARVGNERAIDAAHRALEDAELDEVSRYLALAALPPLTRAELPDARALLTSLRADIAQTTENPVEQPIELRRVSPANLLMAAGALLGVYLLVGELAGIDYATVFSSAIWTWVVVAFLLSPIPQFTSSIALMGAVAAPLPFKPVLGEQFANNFTGLVGGTLANTALVIRFFQKQGQKAAVAVSSGVLISIAAGAVQLVVVVVGLYFTATSFHPSSAGGHSAAGLFIVVLVIGVVLASAIVFVPKLRARVKKIVAPQWQAARDNLTNILRTPRKAAMLFGGNLASQILFALVLDASLHAYGESLPLLQIMVINSLASILGGAAPVPGGMGVVEAGMIAGLTAAGIPQEQAVAATFTHRLFTAYLPPVWGWFALQWLRRNDYV